MRTFLLLILLAAAVAGGYLAYSYFSAPRTFEDGSIGRVDREETVAQICGAGDDCAIAETDAGFFLQNLLLTNETGLMRASLIDETVLTLGPNTELLIDEFVYKPRTIGTFIADLTTGSFRMTTGKTGGAFVKDMRVETETASIGVRGTDFWVRRLGENVDIVLIDGEVVVTNDAGAVTLSRPGDYASVSGADAAPVKRDDLPPGQLLELLSSTAFDDELAELLNSSETFSAEDQE